MNAKLFLVVIAVSICSSLQKSVEVTTNDGVVAGIAHHNTFFNTTINVFKGIRYAQPPTGSLRFKKPVPVERWSGVYNATKFGPDCWQSTTKSGMSLSEDCLFLNIWVPADPKTSKAYKPKTVMFWVHGGGLLSGTGNLVGNHFASHGVVLVSINYRLGSFGFLYSGDDNAPGNVAFHDMTLALTWVRNNIDKFGGDPNDITIFGQSAGSWSVGHLIVSPKSRNLFKRAILESGSSYYYIGKGAADKDVHAKDAKDFAKTLNCTGAEWLDCVKNVSAKRLNSRGSNRPNSYRSFFIDKPIYGDEFMPETAQKLMTSGQFRTNSQILAGVTEHEGTYWARSHLNKIRDASKDFTKEELKGILEKFNEIMYRRRRPEIDIKKLVDFYLANQTVRNQVALKRSFSAALGDFLITCPTHFFAKDYARWSANNTVYFYQLNHFNKKSCAPWMGACHSCQFPFVFGYPIDDQKTYSKTDLNFSLLVMHIWTSFAKTGKLSLDEKPLKEIRLPGVNVTNIDWPSFRSGRVIPKAMILDPKDFGKIIVELNKESCDGFWNEYFNY